MEVQVSFKNERHHIKLDSEATAGSLMKEIEKLHGIKPENQKIICRGKPLNEPSQPLSDGMKLLLMASAAPLASSIPRTANTSRTYSLFKPQIIDTLKEQYHQSVIQNGPPEGAIKPCSFQVSVLPQSPIYVRNKEGKRCSMSVESDAICLISDEMQVERIFFTDITRASTIAIPNFDGFVSLGIITKGGNKWIYFIPSQFQGVMHSLLPQ